MWPQHFLEDQGPARSCSTQRDMQGPHGQGLMPGKEGGPAAVLSCVGEDFSLQLCSERVYTHAKPAPSG